MKPSSPLSHINILAKGWNIPNVYIKDADKLFREYDTYVFKLEANLTDYKLERASPDDVKLKFISPDQQIPPADLDSPGSERAGFRTAGADQESRGRNAVDRAGRTRARRAGNVQGNRPR